MGQIIAPSQDDIADVQGDAMSRRDRKLMERLAAQPVTRKELPMAVANIVEPGFKKLYNRSSEVALTVIAMAELMMEKGLITREEIEAKENAIMESAQKSVEQPEATPNSPALEDALSNAPEGADVEFLTDTDVDVDVDEEIAPRRIILG
jgi:hypothetical protein